MRQLSGLGASKGLAMGKAYHLNEINLPSSPVASKGNDIEQRCLLSALANTKSKVSLAKAKATSKEAAEILEAHLLFLSDPEFISTAEKKVSSGLSAYDAVTETAEQFEHMLSALDDPYLKERAQDVRDVSRSWRLQILGIEDQMTFPDTGEWILVADDLTPSVTAGLNPKVICGIVSQRGGKTSHTAIIANNLGIPAVLGCQGALNEIANEELLLIDGTKGLIIASPDESMQRTWLSHMTKQQSNAEVLNAFRGVEARTKDGVRIEVSANIGGPEEVPKAIEFGAEGVGLFRTEFVYMDQQDFPSEEMQTKLYTKAVENLSQRPMIFRTFDIGGDKELSYFKLPAEMNPFMGYRALRISLKEPTLFETQIRAMLRASVHGPCKIMFPMVASLNEFRAAKAFVLEMAETLRREGVPVPEDIPIGIMVEVPAVAAAAKLFAKEADFFSIGTNDLTQYTVAADRMNEQIADIYEPFNPGVVHLMANTLRAAKTAGIMGGMCGELAGSVLALPMLIGFGISELSMSPSKMPAIKHAMSLIDSQSATQLANELLEMSTAEEIQSALTAFLKTCGIE